MRQLKQATHRDAETIDFAINDLRKVRTALRAAGAPMAARAVQRAINSAEGARRHVDRRIAHSPNGGDTRTGCTERVCYCHVDPHPIGFACSSCGCRVTSTETYPRAFAGRRVS